MSSFTLSPYLTREILDLKLFNALLHQKLSFASLSVAASWVHRVSARFQRIVGGNSSPLPPGWQELDCQGVPYYFQAASGLSVWERPTAAFSSKERRDKGLEITI